MKLFSNKSGHRGIAMTEYLIILALIAVFCVVVATLFGTQIKQIWENMITAMTPATTTTPTK